MILENISVRLRTYGLAVICLLSTLAYGQKSIQDFGVSSTKSAQENKRCLQEAIDWASGSGSALYVDPSAEPYPPTIQVSQTQSAQGIYLSSLTFYGAYLPFDFNANPKHPCELMVFEHCYGYPLSGEFIRIDYCYDVPRILHCHVNPAIQRFIEGQGHTSLSNVEAFSGSNGALTTAPMSWDYLLIRGNQKLTVTIMGARMRNYASDHPFTIENKKAIIQAIGCIDKDEEVFEFKSSLNKTAN